MTPNLPEGYTLTARKLLRSEIWQKPAEFLKVFEFIKQRVAHLDGTTYKRGQGYFDFKQAGIPCVSKGQWERALKFLRKTETITSKRSGRGLIITLVNYDAYQDATNYYSDPSDRPDKKPRRRRASDGKKPAAKTPKAQSRDTAEDDAVAALIRADGDAKEFPRVLAGLTDKYKDFGKKDGLTVAQAAKDIFDYQKKRGLI